MWQEHSQPGYAVPLKIRSHLARERLIYILIFSEYLFCWLFAKDIANLKEEFLKNPSLDPHMNDSQTIKDYPDFEQRLGKFARLLMLEDAKNPEVKKIIRANPNDSQEMSK